MLFDKPAVTHKVKLTAGLKKAAAGDQATDGEMRLICPNCGAQYEVPDEVIPEDGRDVQCSNCGDTWFQSHPDHPHTAEPDEPAEPGETVAVADADVAADEDEDTPDWVEVDADGLPPAALPEETDVIFVTPSHQAPTSATMPMARRRALLERARALDALIVEDDALEPEVLEPLERIDDAAATNLGRLLREAQERRRPS